MEQSTHARLLDFGWSYRVNEDHGWVIYRNPATGQWHSRDEAIRILEEVYTVPLGCASAIIRPKMGAHEEHVRKA